ncbi:MAG: hypothetical protein V4531_09850 [Actinomycetota bacterium]
MKSFEDVLHNSPDSEGVRFNSDPARTEGAVLDTGMVALDDAALPPPLSSFEHVARSTGSRESLVPPRPPWPFSLRAHPHRQAG